MIKYQTMQELIDELKPSQAVMREWLWLERGVIIGKDTDSLVEAARHQPDYTDKQRIQTAIDAENYKNQMTINATYQGVDFWSRCQITTEKGTKLVDTNCLDPDALIADPSLGHWHTVVGPEEEPCSAINPAVILNITKQ